MGGSEGYLPQRREPSSPLCAFLFDLLQAFCPPPPSSPASVVGASRPYDERACGFSVPAINSRAAGGGREVGQKSPHSGVRGPSPTVSLLTNIACQPAWRGERDRTSPQSFTGRLVD